MVFRPKDPAGYRWLGIALTTGRVPAEERSNRNMGALRRLLELPPNAAEADINRELATYTVSGRHRGVQ